MLPFDITKVDENYLQNLCDTKCPESESLDFKRELPGKLEQDRNEFLKDVCALANAGGGDLVYGIGELDGCAEGIFPAPAELADETKLRFSQLLDAGLDPRVPGVRLHQVNLAGGFALIVRVPAILRWPSLRPAQQQ